MSAANPVIIGYSNVIRETEKAKQVELDDGRECWLPVSKVTFHEQKKIAVTSESFWKLKEEEMELDRPVPIGRKHDGDDPEKKTLPFAYQITHGDKEYNRRIYILRHKLEKEGDLYVAPPFFVKSAIFWNLDNIQDQDLLRKIVLGSDEIEISSEHQEFLHFFDDIDFKDEKISKERYPNLHSVLNDKDSGEEEATHEAEPGDQQDEVTE